MSKGTSSCVRWFSNLGLPNKSLAVHLLGISRSKVYYRVFTQVRLIYSGGRLKLEDKFNRSKQLLQRHRHHFYDLNSRRYFSSLPKMSRHFSLGEGTYKVPMDLFASNRNRLCQQLKQLPDLPKNSVVVLQGGQEIPRYCTDTVYLFRQVISYI